MIRTHFSLVCFLLALLFTACGSGGAESTAVASTNVQDGPASAAPGSRTFQKDALIYAGNGAWQPEVASLKELLSNNGATFEAVTSSELNAMSLDDLAQFGAIIWPGGYGNQQTDSLTSATIVNLRKAVRERGVGWVGFCAGAFVAVNPIPAEGQDPEYGIAIFDGPMLKYYYLEEEFVKQGKVDQDWAMVRHSFADGTQRDIIWYGGPVTPDIPGHVVAKYPNGDAAISQLWAGNGLMILAATHPAAPQSALDSFGLTDSDGLDFDIAWKLIEAAITQREVPTVPQ